MDKHTKLQHLANGFHAAGRINNIRKSNSLTRSEDSSNSINISILKEMLQTIAEFSPTAHRGPLEGTLHRSYEYIDTYQNLKNHFRAVSNQKINTESIVRTLGLIKPVVNNSQQNMIEKLLRIYEIIKS
jgi:hypothetical protein